jgi:hypothetical protein
MNGPNVYKDWTQVTRQEFEAHLKTCADYLKDGWADGDYYRYRHNAKQFGFKGLNGKHYIDYEKIK